MFQFARVCALGAVLLAQATAAPQAPPPPAPPSQQPQQPPPRFRAETNLVRVDVYATKDGVPVQDLTAADFEVFEDNAPQKIESFEHIVVRHRRAAGARSEPTSVTAANALAADPRRRVFVIYLDINHVELRGLARDQGAADRSDAAGDERRRSDRRDDARHEPVADHVRPTDQADRGRPRGQLGAGDARADSCRSRTIARSCTPNVSRRSAPWKAIPLRSPRS